jgi:hypothetical protein
VCLTSLLKGSCSASLIKLAPFWTSFLSCSLCHRVPSASMTHGKPEQYLDSWKHDQTDMSQQWETCKVPSISFILIKGRPNHWWRKFEKQEATKMCKEFMWRYWWWASNWKKRVTHCKHKGSILYSNLVDQFALGACQICAEMLLNMCWQILCVILISTRLSAQPWIKLYSMNCIAVVP